MEFYLSVSELLGMTANPLILIFVPIFLFTALAEALLILHRHGTYPRTPARCTTKTDRGI